MSCNDDAYVEKRPSVLQLLCILLLRPLVSAPKLSVGMSVGGEVVWREVSGRLNLFSAWTSLIRPSIASLAETICQLSNADLTWGLAPATHGEYTQLLGECSELSILLLFAAGERSLQGTLFFFCTIFVFVSAFCRFG